MPRIPCEAVQRPGAGTNSRPAERHTSWGFVLDLPPVSELHTYASARATAAAAAAASAARTESGAVPAFHGIQGAPGTVCSSPEHPPHPGQSPSLSSLLGTRHPETSSGAHQEQDSSQKVAGQAKPLASSGVAPNDSVTEASNTRIPPAAQHAAVPSVGSTAAPLSAAEAASAVQHIGGGADGSAASRLPAETATVVQSEPPLLAAFQRSRLFHCPDAVEAMAASYGASEVFHGLQV